MNTGNQTTLQRLVEEVKQECEGDETKINEIIRSAVSSSAEKQCKYSLFAKDMELIASRTLAFAFLKADKRKSNKERDILISDLKSILERHDITFLNWNGILEGLKGF